MRWILGGCLGLGIALLLLAVYLGVDLVETRQASIREAGAMARQQAANAAREIGSDLDRYASLADQLAEEISSGRLSAEGLNARLMEIMEASPDLDTAGIAYAPSSSDPERRLHAPACVRRGGVLQLSQLDGDLDYTNPEVVWYANAIKGQSGWVEPIWHEAGRFITSVYATPFSLSDGDRDGQPEGVAFLFMNMDGIEKRVAELDLGHTGYGTVVSQQGYFLVHPSPVSVQEHINVFHLPEVQSDETARQAVENATGGGRGMLHLENRLTGQASFFFYEPIPDPGWSMFVTLIKDEIPRDPRLLRQQVIKISVSAIFGLIAVAVWFFVGLHQKHPRDLILWCLVAFSSVLLFVGLAVIRYVVYNQAAEDDRESISVVDQSGLDALNQSRLIQAQSGEQLSFIPTGVFLQSMKFTGSDEILITGYVWQKHAANLPQEISQGFTLPDAINPTMVEAYRRREDDLETIGWYFEATIRQQMNVSRYPFDHSDVSIRLWHGDFDPNVVLVPDLAAYSLMNPAARPGLDKELAVSGWNVAGSFFDYKFVEYQTDLGIPDQFVGGRRAELNFNVRLKRHLLDVSVSNGIPLGIVFIMLFAILVTATKDEDESQILGFNPSGVMKIGSALFFVVLLAHMQLRNTLNVHEVVFMEYFYFSVYLAIMLVSLHNFLFSLKRYNRGPLGHKNGLVQKLLFWPLFLSGLLVITILHFY